MKNQWTAMILASLFIVGGLAEAQEYQFFEIENEASSGTFGWDLFAGFYLQPHLATIGETDGMLQVSPGGGVVSSTLNLYSADSVPRYDFLVSNLDVSKPFTSLVIQIGITGNADGSMLMPLDFALEVEQDGEFVGLMPDNFEDLGSRATIAGAFEVYYYWVEWNGLPASDSFSLSLQSTSNNVSFTAARISYFNSAEPLDVTFGDSVLLGDVNCDGMINLLDVAPFVDSVSTGTFNAKADMNSDGAVDLLDVQPFVTVLSN